MSDLVDFLRRWIDDDERIATFALDSPIGPDDASSPQVQQWGPERVLDECTAKRRIVDQLERSEIRHQDARARATDLPPGESLGAATADRRQAALLLGVAREAALALAAVWRARPGYRDEWARRDGVH